MDVTKSFRIAFKGLKNGRHTFDFEVGEALFEASGNTEIKGGACRAHVELDRAETMLGFDVTIDGSVVVACDRCLEDCEVPVRFAGHLTVKFSDETDEYDGEMMWISPSESEVDLAQYIYESIVLSLPYQRVHPDGECDPEMLGRFRIVTDEEFSAIEARAAADEGSIPAESRSALEALKRRLEADDGTHEA